ncbi:camphor resistance protein CrcB [Halomonas campisalis]|uniref:Fluoride-specific ion channel FluC n=1 Tax=Billgrantia campisalis TaxID=74661 RepID=A0ABS9PCV8_9GAMM|nr:CrcB family protein [Halomonas campisalis]MCG6659598.1 camphor resistance protein CrcB [Halomonas campisalis]MDR5864559.1 CrcB family protein [Halomonas campisalis]
MSVGFSSLLLVAVGGALGGMGRLAVTNLVTRRLGATFPWGTLVVNLSGALVAGWVAGRLGVPTSLELSAAWLGLAVGVLGGYTTVSSFSLQTLSLWQSGYPRRAVGNVLATCLIGLLLAALGWWLAGGAQ